MSKFEVLQNNRLGKEKEKIKNFFNATFTSWLKESKKKILTYDLQRFTFSILRVGFILYVANNISNGMFTIGDLALYWMLLNQIYANIQDINSYITSMHQDVIFIDKLWETFDTNLTLR